MKIGISQRARIDILALLVLSIFILAGCSVEGRKNLPSATLTIVHTNDLEGALRPCSCLSDPAGGAARRATALRQLREKDSNLLLLDAGDALFGTPVSDNTGGVVQVEVMNFLGYDAAALGDRDFSYGLKPLMEAVKNARFPVLSANILNRETDQPLTQSSVILKKGALKIAILGLTSPKVEQLWSADPQLSAQLKVEDPILVAKKLVPALLRDADLVLVLSHLGETLDAGLAEKVPGITAIIGGHNRKVIDPPHLLANNLPLVQVGYQGDLLGVLNLEFSGTNSAVKIKTENIKLSSEFVSDPAMSFLVAHYEALAAWNGDLLPSDILGATYPLDVVKASARIKKAYLLATAFPDGFEEAINKSGDHASSGPCFINQVDPGFKLDYSLAGLEEEGCLRAVEKLAAGFPKKPAGQRINPAYWSED